MPDTKKKKSKVAELALKHESGWLSKAAKAKPITAFCEDYRKFLTEVKTEREAHDFGVRLAHQAGYGDFAAAVAEGKRLEPGAKLCYSVGGKTLLLFQVGRRPLAEGLRIVGGHTDSPRLDLKPRPLYEDGGMALLDTHYYGGVRKYQWLTMPLALHGVVARKDGKLVPVCIGEDPKDPVFCITDLLPHLGKDQGQKKLAEAHTGEGLNVLFGSQPEDDDSKDPIKLKVLGLLHDKFGIDEDDLHSAELEIVPAGPARHLGLDSSMLLGYGQDDRVSAYTAMRALLDLADTPEYTGVCILCDKEEIGSVGSTGMDSHIFENAVAELLHLVAPGPDEGLVLRRCLRNSKMLSADVNALHDPNYADVSSPNNNMAKLNHGLIISKYVGARGKSGSNDASAEYMAFIRKVFDDAGVVWQTGEIGKVDQGGGGTIAYMLARYEMEVVDCGVGLLSMHAPYEVSGKFDVFMAYKGYGAFYAAG